MRVNGEKMVMYQMIWIFLQPVVLERNSWNYFRHLSFSSLSDNSFLFVNLKMVLPEDSDSYPLGSDSVGLESISDLDYSLFFGGCLSLINNDVLRLRFFKVALDDFFDDFSFNFAVLCSFGNFLCADVEEIDDCFLDDSLRGGFVRELLFHYQI